jgi:transcriptional regulator with XRE-family HTH domain
VGTLNQQEARFAHNVAQVRRSRGMSQEELAARVGIGRTAISAVEAGGRRIRLGEACDIARALQVSLDDLISDKPITIQLPAAAPGGPA